MIKSLGKSQTQGVELRNVGSKRVALAYFIGLDGVVQLRQFPAPVMDACLKAAFEVYADVSAKNADFKKVWESLLAFRNDAYLWWRVAEYTYDDFLVRNRTRT